MDIQKALKNQKDKGTSIQLSTKNKKLEKFTDKELLAEIIQRGFRVSGRLPEPISAQCFQCQEQFLIKWVVTQQDYAKKNNWDYWIGKKTDQNLKICNACLREFYLRNRKGFLTITNCKIPTRFFKFSPNQRICQE